MRPNPLLAASLLALAVPAEVPAQCGGEKIVAPLGAGAEVGRSIDVDGDDLVVGSPATDSVAFFRRTNGVWLPEGPPLSIGSGVGFGTSVSVRYGVALVGMPGETVNGLAGAGLVHILLHTAGSWTPIWTLASPTPSANAGFGSSVDNDGTWYMVGEPGWASDRGRAHVFVMTSSGIGQLHQTLVHAAVAGGARFGSAVAIEGVAAVAGAPGADLNGLVDNGGAFPYRIAMAGQWASLPASTLPVPGAGFGRSVDLAGDSIVFGSQGRGFQFLRFDGQTYQRDAFEVAPPGDDLGWAVAVDGHRAVVTSPADAGAAAAANVGSFRTFVYDGNDFVAASGAGVYPLHDGTSRLGDSAALAGTRLALGAPLDATGGANAGAAYVYDLTRTSWLHALYGADGLAGAGGVAPEIDIEGTLCADEPLWLAVDAAAPFAPVVLIAGLAYAPAPLLGGTLGPSADLVVVGLATDAAGDAALSAAMPGVVPPGVDVHLQAWVQDAGAPLGYAATPTYRLTTPFPN